MGKTKYTLHNTSSILLRNIFHKGRIYFIIKHVKSMMKKNGLGKLAWLLVIIGALNWGLYGVGMLMGRDLNLVYMLVGNWMTIEALVYILVGLAGLYLLVAGKKGCSCGNGNM